MTNHGARIFLSQQGLELGEGLLSRQSVVGEDVPYGRQTWPPEKGRIQSLPCSWYNPDSAGSIVFCDKAQTLIDEG